MPDRTDNDLLDTALALEMTPAEIEARMRWARRQGYIAWYWPDVAVDDWRDALLEIERATRAMLTGTTGARLDRIGDSSRALGIASFTAGMGPLLGAWIEAGHIETDAETRTLLLTHLAHGRVRARRMRAAADRAIETLANAGIPTVAVKALHTAHVYFEEPGHRPAADIDLVLSPSHVGTAQQALERAGYALVKRRRRPHKSDWFPPGAPRTLRSVDLTHRDNPFTLELHGTLDRDFYGVHTVRFGTIAHLSIGPAPWLHPSVSVLEQPLLTAYLAAHASEELHQLQLIRLVELVLVMRRDAATGALDWRGLGALIENRDAMRFVYPALSLAERLAPGTVDPWLLERATAAATPRMLRVLSTLGPGTAQRLDGLSLDERFLWVSGPVEFARRVVRIFGPPGDGRSLIRYWVERLLRLVRGRVSIRRRPAKSKRDRETQSVGP